MVVVGMVMWRDASSIAAQTRTDVCAAVRSAFLVLADDMRVVGQLYEKGSLLLVVLSQAKEMLLFALA